MTTADSPIRASELHVETVLLNPQPLPPGVRINLVGLNPQPLPPDATINLVGLNPQPLPPDATINLVALNPQPMPPGVRINLVALNPQPLPPSVTVDFVALNPQPLPPGDRGRSIDFVSLNPHRCRLSRARRSDDSAGRLVGTRPLGGRRRGVAPTLDMDTLRLVSTPTSRQEFDFDQKDKHGLPTARASRISSGGGAGGGVARLSEVSPFAVAGIDDNTAPAKPRSAATTDLANILPTDMRPHGSQSVRCGIG